MAPKPKFQDGKEFFKLMELFLLVPSLIFPNRFHDHLCELIVTYFRALHFFYFSFN